MYVSAQEYHERTRFSAVPDEKLEGALRQAEDEVDTLTYNRIAHKGFDALTPYQQDHVKQAVVEQADFVAQYGDMLQNPLSSYGINGVTMAWDNQKVRIIGGVYTSNTVYSLLLKTGMTYRGVV